MEIRQVLIDYAERNEHVYLVRLVSDVQYSFCHLNIFGFVIFLKQTTLFHGFTRSSWSIKDIFCVNNVDIILLRELPVTTCIVKELHYNFTDFNIGVFCKDIK